MASTADTQRGYSKARGVRKTRGLLRGTGAAGPVMVVVLAALSFVLSLGNSFVFDDATMIQENPMIRDLRNLPEMLSTDYWGTLGRPDLFAGTLLYRPLVIVSLAVNYAVGGLHPVGYHLLNILLHMGVSLAVYCVARQLACSREAATIGATVFAVHPLHTEAVVYVVGRAELLMALGVLWGLHEYIRGRAWRSMPAFAVALLAKEQAVVFPAVLLLHDLCMRLASVTTSSGRVVSGYQRGVGTDRAAPFETAPEKMRPPQGERKKLSKTRKSTDRPEEHRLFVGVSKGAFPQGTLMRRLLPSVSLLVMYLVVRTSVLGVQATPVTSVLDNPLAQAPLGTRVLTGFAVSVRYLCLCVWPFPLSPDYSFNQIPLITSPLDGWVACAVAAWLGLAYVAWRSLRTGTGAAAFAVGFTALTFLPASNLLFPIGTIMGERLFYLPSAGLCWLAGLGWDRLRGIVGAVREPPLEPRVGTVGSGGSRTAPTRSVWHATQATVILVVVGLCLLSMRYSLAWRDPLTLYRYAVTAAPDSAKMRYFFASFLMTNAAEAMPEAAQHLRRAVEILPGFGEAWDALGRSYIALQRPDDAVAALEAAVALNARDARYQVNLGIAYKSAGRWDDAIAALRRAIALEPRFVLAHRSLADTYTRMGLTRAAQVQGQLAQNPNDARAWAQAGTVFLELEWFDEAAHAFEVALRLDPRLVDARRGLEEAKRRMQR